MKNIIDELKNKAIDWHGETLFSARNARLVIELAHSRNIKILGIDGFFLCGGKRQPSLEHCCDFTLPGTEVTDTHRAALDFLRGRDNLNLYFEIVLPREK